MNLFFKEINKKKYNFLTSEGFGFFFSIRTKFKNEIKIAHVSDDLYLPIATCKNQVLISPAHSSYVKTVQLLLTYQDDPPDSVPQLPHTSRIKEYFHPSFLPPTSTPAILLTTPSYCTPSPQTNQHFYTLRLHKHPAGIPHQDQRCSRVHLH